LELEIAANTTPQKVSIASSPRKPSREVTISLPSSPLTLSSAAVADQTNSPMSATPVIKLTGSVGPHKVQVDFLVDSGATALFIDTKLAERCGLQVLPSGRAITLADGSTRTAAGTTTAQCTMQSAAGGTVEFSGEFCVTELQGHDAILGMPWLHFFNPAIDWREGSFTINRPAGSSRPLVLNRAERSALLRSPSRKTAVNAADASSADGGSRAHLLTRSQFGKMFSKDHVDLSTLEIVKLRRAVSPTVAAALQVYAAAFDESPQGQLLQKLLAEFKDVMPDQLPPVDLNAPSPGGIEHQIELVPDAKPHAAPLRRYSPIEQAVIDEYLVAELTSGRVVESKSPWGAMVLLARKKDGTLRFCADYRVLNNATVKNRYALPLADDCFDKAHGAKYFSKLDLRTGFWQIKVHPNSRSCTAFRTNSGHYEYTVLPMGLCNAPGTFMHVMNSVFREQLGKFVLVFLDDIFVYSRTEAEHLEHLRAVLEVLRKNKLYLKAAKCEWMKEEVEFLGHRIGREGLSVDPHKVDAVRDWPTPTNVSELRSFLGLAGYYRRFLDHYSQVALSLTELTKDEVEWTWGAEQNAAFEKLKSMLSGAPVLKLADPTLPYTIHCDASGFAVGACLMQDHGEGLQPVSYISAKMKPAETRYAPHEQELLALVHACRSWRHYLHSEQPFTVLSDHQSLRFFTTQPILSMRQARWKDLLAEFNFVIKYIEGPKNVVADALSRRVDHQQSLQTRIDSSTEAATREQLLASITLAPIEDITPISQARVLEQYQLSAAQLRARQSARPPVAVDSAQVAADRLKARQAATEILPLDPNESRPPANGHGAIVMPTQRCTADNKRGGHCGAKTKRGQYCYFHRKQISGLHIKAATVKVHGLALHTTRAFLKGETVSEYSGDLVGADAHGNYVLALRKKDGGSVDAARTNTADGRWINDCRGIKSARGWQIKPNCIFVEGNVDRPPIVRAARALRAGEEIYVSYGPEYWPRVTKARKTARAPEEARIMLEEAAELNSATLVFGDYHLVTSVRASAAVDKQYQAQLADPPKGMTARDRLLWMGERLVIPADPALRTLLLAESHDTPTGGHFGRDKTLFALSRRFFWEGMSTESAEYVRTCDTCQRIKPSRQNTPGLLMPLPVPEQIDSHWTMDFITGLPKTARGCDAIQGHYSRGGSIKRLAATNQTVTASRAAEIFVSSVVRHHGVPASVVSDRGPQFTARFWQALMARMGTQLHMSTANHPQSDGKSEREGGTLETWLRAFCTEHPEDWDLLLPLAELALNCTPSSAAGVEPYQLLYGRNPATSVDRALAPDVRADQLVADVPAARERWARMAAAWTKVRDKLVGAQQRMANYADRHRRDVRYDVGDMVLLSTTHLKVADSEFNAKLAHLYCGPFRVKRVINANAYELELPEHMHNHAVVNVSHLRAYRDGSKQFAGRPAPVGLSRPPPERSDPAGDAYVVERILAQQGRGARARYLVLWKGYGYESATWEDAENMAGAADSVAEFLQLQRDAGPRRAKSHRKRGR